jgi:hypothetical protein
MISAGNRAASERRRHQEMLAISLIALLGSLLLQVRADDRVAPRLLGRWALPPLCLSQAVFGVRCPGCGLTRSFVNLAQGDWRAAWAHHRLGWALWLAVLLQIPYRFVALRRPGTPVLGNLLPKLFGYALIAGLIGNWALEMLGY